MYTACSLVMQILPAATASNRSLTATASKFDRNSFEVCAPICLWSRLVTRSVAEDPYCILPMMVEVSGATQCSLKSVRKSNSGPPRHWLVYWLLMRSAYDWDAGDHSELKKAVLLGFFFLHVGEQFWSLCATWTFRLSIVLSVDVELPVW